VFGCLRLCYVVLVPFKVPLACDSGSNMVPFFKLLIARGIYPYMWWFSKVHFARGSFANMGPPFKVLLARGIVSNMVPLTLVWLI